MGLIDDITMKIVPETQKLMEKEGIALREALIRAFREFGYISSEEILKKK